MQWRRHILPRLAAVAVALATLSCATTNFLDPVGPRYTGGYAVEKAGPTLSADAPLRVVTFNIQHARRIDRALALLRSDPNLRGPDLLLLQEMDAVSVDTIARELRLRYVYFPSAVHPRSGRQFGAAILSPWPLDEPRKIALPHAAFGTNVRRSVTSAVMRRGGLRMRVYSVHLPAPVSISNASRKEQVRIIVRDAATSRDPILIAGDFNERLVGSWFSESGFLWLTDQLPGTSRGLGFWWSFDHVFVRGLRMARQAPAAGVVDPAGASDHRAVWVLLEPNPA